MKFHKIEFKKGKMYVDLTLFNYNKETNSKRLPTSNVSASSKIRKQ